MKSPKKGDRVEATAKIHRSQATPGYMPATIEPGTKGTVLYADAYHRGIAVKFDTSRRHHSVSPQAVVLWTGRDYPTAVELFWSDMKKAKGARRNGKTKRSVASAPRKPGSVLAAALRRDK